MRKPRNINQASHRNVRNAKTKTQNQKSQIYKPRGQKKTIKNKIIPKKIYVETPYLNNGVTQGRITVTKMDVNPKTKNLNDLKECPDFIMCEGKVVRNYVKDYTESHNVKLVNIFHSNLHQHFTTIMNKYGRNRIVVGCMAWLTSDELINTISCAKQVALVVNDEDYSKWGSGCVTRQKYQKLPGFKRPFSEIWGNKITTPLNILNKIYEPVRCFGSDGRHHFSPIMHIKTLIICDDDDMPRWVWQGSMNFTKNSQNNLENAVFIDDQNIALSSFLNFGNIFIFSKPVRY
jgi:hypothetical protein